jgi:hypothetical protein
VRADEFVIFIVLIADPPLLTVSKERFCLSVGAYLTSQSEPWQFHSRR